MKAKEKALELYRYYEQLGRDFTRGVSMKEFAKLCALKAVDEILQITEHESPSTYVYYMKVKQEIKLFGQTDRGAYAVYEFPSKEEQKELIIDIMEADEKDGLYS